MLPEDPVMLLSFVNTKLRDFYDSFEEFCKDFDVDPNEIIEKLATIDYHINVSKNQFE